MAGQIVWTLKAQEDRKRILEFWKDHNKSAIYSRKLNRLFIESLKLVCKNPNIGKRTNKDQVRAKIVKDYMIFYEAKGNHIVVLSVWDCH